MSNTIETIVELTSVLRRLDEARRDLTEVPASMRELHEQHVRLREELDTLEETAREAEQERRTAEGEADELQVKIEHYQTQISEVSTQREYGALLREIDTAKQAKRTLEESGISAIERQDEAKTLRETRQAEFDGIDAQYKEGIAEWENRKPEIATEIESLEAREEVLRSSLPSAPLRIFEQLYERHSGDPLAQILPVERAGNQRMYTCSACNYQVRPQVVVELRSTGQLKTCECGRQRIFYIDDTAG